MIQLRRILVCDGPDCPNVSLTVMATVDVGDGQLPNWQGWKADGERHLCPECVAANVQAPEHLVAPS